MLKLISIFLVITMLFVVQPVAANELVVDDSKEQIEARALDRQAKILADYLAHFNSPLQYHAQDLSDAAKEYDLDWRLLPAIAGVESTFGQFIPAGSKNAWGWGVYGNQAIYFRTWREGIFEVAKGLRENYFNKGLTNPYAINRAYAVSPYWGGKVNYFMSDLEKFTQKYPYQTQAQAARLIQQTAVASAKLVI